MERLRQRLAVARTALGSLNELLQKPPAGAVERDAAIQRFEYTVGAVWRAAQRHLEIVEGLSSGSPKAATRLCREAGLLDDEQATQALEMVDDRNMTVHTYNEQIAQRIYPPSPEATGVSPWGSTATFLGMPRSWSTG